MAIGDNGVTGFRAPRHTYLVLATVSRIRLSRWSPSHCTATLRPTEGASCVLRTAGYKRKLFRTMRAGFRACVLQFFCCRQHRSIQLALQSKGGRAESSRMRKCGPMKRGLSATD